MSEISALDHLFISYAPDDWALAEWLTLRLTAEGYRVWCDRFRLLGGEPFPRDVEDAIEHHTFRLIALFSRAYMSKPQPTKERALALKLARERSMDFLIPLKVDDLSPTELDGMTRDLPFIPFVERWATGFNQLLTKVRLIGTPHPLANGEQIAADAQQALKLRGWHTVL